jgi:hemoglobin/transferrin/lactoferrin receptor protein
MRACSIRLLRSAFAAAALAPVLSIAQQSPAGQAGDSARTKLKAVTITATRQKTDVHDVPTPVSVVDDATIRGQTPNNATDLLRSLPGVDVIGVGPNQSRPSIRGQRGQRILLLQDGMRLNNSRRQQDFGELPALVDVSGIERVEVVRGPASVLYGTDAIGGVINLITRVPSYGTEAATVGGRVGYRYGTTGEMGKAEALVSGRAGEFAWQVGGTSRRAGNYDAPAGTFGSLRLAKDVTVQDAGVKDHSANVYLGWRSTNGVGAFAKVEQYVADDAGFGFVQNSLLGGDDTRIQIRYPHQNFTKATLGLSAASLGLPFIDRADLTAYTQRNKRDLAQDIFIPFGPGTPPGAGVSVITANYTDLASSGFRAEGSKLISRAVLTFGLDGFEDRSFNTDTNTTTVLGFGPPRPSASNKAVVPNAALSSVGTFVQANVQLHERASLIVGGRFQTVRSETRDTPKYTANATSHSNATGVYAANALVRITDALNVVGSVGSGFRAPNLVERYFDGPTPEGSAYQQASPDLNPETSVNYDVGLKYRARRLNAEVSVFENHITDAIIPKPTGAILNRLPVYQNVNVGELRTRGAEFGATVLLDAGFSINGNWSTIKSTNVLDPKSPIGDTFANKLILALDWNDGSGRWWAEYGVRRNGEQKDIAVGASPVGNTLPSFTLHSIRAGLRGWTVGSLRQDLTLGVNNLTNVLYSEAANSSFFRPEPKRNVVLSVSTAF